MASLPAPIASTPGSTPPSSLPSTSPPPPPAANATEDQPSSRQLVYDLAVDLSFRNAHRRLSIRYLDTKLGPADDALPLFRQNPKNTTVLHPAFRGVVAVDGGTAAELEREAAEGTVHVKKVQFDSHNIDSIRYGSRSCIPETKYIHYSTIKTGVE
uniref:Uncharacterized protein n=1 Tax=Oryza rufipogon TaxID=4529 RepID=A0A0E0PIS1_ORYRU